MKLTCLTFYELTLLDEIFRLLKTGKMSVYQKHIRIPIKVLLLSSLHKVLLITHKNSSYRCLHALAPWTMHCGSDIIIPVISDSSLWTEFASNSLTSYQRVTRDYARFPLSFATVADKWSFIDLSSTVLTVSLRQCLMNWVVHIHAQNPISNAISFFIAYQVLLWQRNLKWRRNISLLEIRIISDSSSFRVFNSIEEI
jgi:hypothetical protein